jgi:hypothetical protein
MFIVPVSDAYEYEPVNPVNQVLPQYSIALSPVFIPLNTITETNSTEFKEKKK